MRLIFSKEQIIQEGAWRAFYQDHVVLNGGVNFGRMPDGRHFIRPEQGPNLPELLAMVATGVGVDEMPVVVKAPSTLLEEAVYAGLPFREDAEGQIRTFADWGAETRLSRDGTMVCMILTVNGRYLRGSEWSQFHVEPLELMTAPAFNALMQSPAWKEDLA